MVVSRRMSLRFLPLFVVCVIAIGRAATAPEPPSAPPADAALKRDIFAGFRAKEAENREKAANDFPTDPWSSDDAFHAYEDDRAQELTKKYHTSKTDVLAALDDGMREAHARGNRPMIPTVPPCHPRAIY